MTEFFVVTNSFAAPFCSDTNERFVKGATPRKALERAVREYKHPCGLFAAMLYTDANAKAKGKKPLLTWLCNHEREKLRITAKLGSYSFCSNAPGDFEVDGVRYTVADPRGGAIVEVPDER